MTAKKKTAPSKPASSITGFDTKLVSDLRDLIITTRQSVARGVNAALVMLYWKVGDRIRRNILHGKRATYGSEILPTLSAKLVPEFGQGFSPRNLARMISFSEMLRYGFRPVCLTTNWMTFSREASASQRPYCSHHG